MQTVELAARAQEALFRERHEAKAVINQELDRMIQAGHLTRKGRAVVRDKKADDGYRRAVGWRNVR